MVEDGRPQGPQDTAEPAVCCTGREKSDRAHTGYTRITDNKDGDKRKEKRLQDGFYYTTCAADRWR